MIASPFELSVRRIFLSSHFDLPAAQLLDLRIRRFHCGVFLSYAKDVREEGKLRRGMKGHERNLGRTRR
jgi:hypothetical protein